MELKEALSIATEIHEALLPHCERCEIAGSIRREKANVKDIEIVLIPKPYEVGLFESGIARIINQWQKVKGELGPQCKYTQRIHPTGIKIDLFFAVPYNWGLIFAIRTGSADYSHHVLASGWVKRGYRSSGGILFDSKKEGEAVYLLEEKDLFDLLNIPMPEPSRRDIDVPNNTVGRGVPSNFERTAGDYNGFIDY